MNNKKANQTKFPGSLNMVNVLEDYAKAVGKTRDKLTDVERTQAVVNAVLACLNQEQA